MTCASTARGEFDTRASLPLAGSEVARQEQRDEIRGAAAAAPPVARSLSALLKELARAPAVRPGSWEGALRPGAAIGRFELVREIGRGGFGIVWEARDTELGRSVAFKAVRLETRVAAREERLLREAELAARLSHPNIVTLHDAGRSEHGPYLILELLRGETLAERLQAGELPLREAVRIAAEVAKGVAHAHGQGVIHRDLKPANVFLCEDGQVKVLDLGLAHAFGQRKVDGGTVEYMAPEQRRGAPEDERTDVFALGAILHRLLAGSPARGEGRARVAALEVPDAPALGELVGRMLEVDPVKRPRDLGEVLGALTVLQRDLERPERADAPAPRPRPRRRLARVRRRLAGRAGALVLASAIAAVAVVAAVAASPAVREHLLGFARRPALPDEKLVAVLPFRQVGGSRSDEAFSAGLVELVTNKLRQLEQLRSSLRVVSPSDVLKEKVASAKEARSAFGATLAVTGSVHWDRDRVVVAADLVDARTLLVVAARDVEAPRADAAALQRALVERVAEMLEIELGPEAGRSAFADPPPAPGAYEFYLEGRGYLQRYDRAENLDSAVAVFDQALARDPAYALAHAGKAEAFLRRYDLTKDARFLEQARASGRRAIELDERLAPVQLTMGLVHAASGDHASAIRSFERALELEPASADAYRELARAYDAAGRTQEAEATYRRAIQLRPSSWAAYKDLGVFYNRHERLTEALPLFQRVVQLTPDNYAGYANLGGLYLRLGLHDEAAAALERSLSLRPTAQAHANLGAVYFYEGRFRDAVPAYREAVRLGRSDARVWGALADSERWSGLAEDAARDYRQAIALLEKELAVDPRSAEPWSRLAIHEAALGERDKAAASIGKALRLAPGDGLVLFRSALVKADAGDTERALDAVRAALEAGYPREFIRNAPPLALLGRDPRFRALVDRKEPAVSNPK